MATTEDERQRLRSVSDIAADAEGGEEGEGGEGEPETDGTPQLILEGLGSRLNGTVGGKHPTESLFKMNGVSLPIAGGVQVAKDTEVWVAIPVAIDEVKVKNRRKARDIVGVVRTHTATAIGQPIILDGPPSGVDE